MKRAALIVTVAILLFVPSAHAGFLVGASVGQASSEVDNSSFDESDTGFSGRIGYRFLKLVGVEIGFVDFGEPSGEVTQGVDLDSSADGFNISAVGALPFAGRWEVFGKLGYFTWDATATATSAIPGIGDDESGSDVSWGAGVAVKVVGPFRIRGEYQVFKLGDLDVSFASIGADFRF
jgi:hypothetical protein